MALSQRRSRLVRRLSSRKLREREGLVLVEGARAADTALRAGARVHFALVTDEEAARAGLVDRLREREVEVERVSRAEIADVADTATPQGVLLVCEEPARLLSEVVAVPGPILVLDAIQDPGNVGTLIRSAVAFGFDGVVALDGTADPWSPKAVRSSAGAVFHALVAKGTAAEALEACRAAGRSLLISDAGGDSVGERESVKWSGRFALAVGNEGAGVRPELREAGSATVSIRMSRDVESLNAGIAGSILMHELRKEQR